MSSGFTNFSGVFGQEPEPKRFTLKEIVATHKIKIGKLRALIKAGKLKACLLRNNISGRKCYYVEEGELSKID